MQGAHYNYRTHEPLRAQAAAPRGGHAFSQFALRKSGELFTQPHRLLAGAPLATTAQLQRQLDQRAAQRAAGQVSLEGSGELVELTPGSLLDVADATGAGYGTFRVLSVRHQVQQGNYQNHFAAMTEAADAPPPNPHYPAAPDAQPELAEVLDLADPRGLGRIRVRFQWDVAQPQDAHSGWLRVSTPYSGDGKGQLFTPEKGSQVLVGYEHGLAELPLVLGNLFHAQNKQGAKYTNAGNHLKGMQTAGGNKVVMSDKKGQQTILLSNSNNKGTAVTIGFEADGNVHIRSNGPVLVNGKTITLEAGEEGQIKLHAKTISLEAEEEVTVSSKRKNIALTAHANVTVLATGEVDLKGRKITKTSG